MAESGASLSVSDARRRFEQMSNPAGKDNVIHDSLLRKPKPLNKRVTSPTLALTKTNVSKSEDSLEPAKESLPSKPKGTKPVKRSSSDAEAKKDKQKSSKMSDSSKSSPTHNGAEKKRRDPPKPPSTSPTHASPPVGDKAPSKTKASPEKSSKSKATPDKSTSKTKLSPEKTNSKAKAAPEKSSSKAKVTIEKGASKSPEKSSFKSKFTSSPKRNNSESTSVRYKPARPPSPVLQKESAQASSGDKKDGDQRKMPPSPKNVVRDKDLEIKLCGASIGGDVLKRILSRQLAYLSGGLEDDKHIILTIPDVGLRQLESREAQEDLMTTVNYLKSLMSSEQVACGVTLLMDARSSKTHQAVKIVLERITAEKFPLKVHIVYLYIKTGLFSRSKNLASPDITAKLNVAYLSEPKAVLDQFESSNITEELGGSLKYDHKNWVYNRLEFEKMQHLYQRAKTRCPEVRDALDLVKVPSSVKEAEHIMTEDLKLKEGLVNRLAEAELSIDHFLEVLKRQHDQGSLEISLGTKDYITMMASLSGMLEDIRNSQAVFDEFWGVHKARVDHMMRMCHFNRTADKTKHLMQGHIDDLTSGGLLLGDTLESSLELGEKHEAFVQKCKSTMDEHMDHIKEDGHVLTNPTFAPQETEETMHSATKEAIGLVKDQLKSLADTYDQLMTLCQQKRDFFIVCVKFHMTTRQCQQWTQDALEHMASQPLEEPSSKTAGELVKQIDNILARVQPAQLSAMMDLAAALPPEKQFNKSAQKTSQKYEQARELLINRKISLQKIIANAAVQAAAATPPANKKSMKKNKIVHSEIEIVNGDNNQDPVTSPSAALENPEVSLYLAKTRASVSAAEYTDGESNEAVLKSRNNVYRELIETEKVYIKDMQTVIDAYYDAMDPDSLSIPLRLRGKRETVFGNLLDIYKFHDSVFSKTLDRYDSQPERVGECFIQFTEEFQMYSEYCKNRSSSETLVNETTESMTFFKGIQRNLGHALDLNAYLLKPVQRITKYQLLLKDMMKHSANATKAHSDLKEALDRMLKVLKNLNDSLHVVGLKGFPGQLAEQGRLLVHDAFTVWDGASVSRSLFSRGKERHVFLFEKVVIFSKKIEVPEEKKKKSEAYLYKAHLDMADLALRESVDAQPLQFVLSMHGQQRLVKLGAPTKEIHAMWTAEIRRLLQVQFTLMKDKVLKSGTLDRKTYKGKARLSTKQRDTHLFDSIKEESPKKSLSNRFNLFKRNKKSTSDVKKPLKTTTSLGVMSSSDASLVASCSVPPSLKYSIGGMRKASHDSSGLSKSNIETTSGNPDESSDDEDLSYDEDDESEVTPMNEHYESLAPGAARYYYALESYNPGHEDNGINLSKEQQVEVLGINPYGWWWVRVTNDCNGELEEGWVPASYLRVLDDLKDDGDKSITCV